MKQLYTLFFSTVAVALFILSFIAASPALAVTVGGPEMSVPEESLFLKEEAVKKALDRYEYVINIKTTLDAEILFKRKLDSSSEVSGVEMEGHNFMFKFSNNFNNIIEPYVKIGTSTLEVAWRQNGYGVKVESGTGVAYGAGVKAKIWELKNYGINLTLDTQYIKTSLDFDKAKLGGSETTAAAITENFNIKEWQTSLLASKKLILPIGRNDYYIIPYTGLTHSYLDVDVYFTQSTNGLLYSTYNASNKDEFGIVLGCDVMPFFLSYYLLNLELRLVNETALTLSGTVKF